MDAILLIISCLIIILIIGYRYYWRCLIYQTITGDYESKVVLITGCDTGFGNSVAVDLDRLGFNVVACCLDSNSEGAIRLRSICSDRLKIVQLDLTDDEQIQKCHEIVLEMCNIKYEFWALINNAALTNYISEVEFMPMKIINKLFEVNLYGAIKMTKLFLPLLRSSKGRIVNISSITAIMHQKQLAAYSCTKSAIETVSDCLRQELKPSGVDVIIVQPSAFKTGGLEDFVLKERFNELCREIIEENRSKNYNQDTGMVIEHLEVLKDQFKKKAIEACQVDLYPVVQVIRNAVVSTRPRSIYRVGRGATVVTILSILPKPFVDFLLSKL